MIKTLFVTIDEFIANGGKLEIGREIYNEERRHFDSDKFDKDAMLNSCLMLGTYIGKDEKHGAYLLKNSTFKSLLVTGTIGYVRVVAEVRYL